MLRSRHVILALIFALTAFSQARADNSYMDMRLEDLMDVTVTSISKRAQPLKETAAAVHVLTADDIRRTGATSVPEALRMVPGLMVGQNTSGIWSVSSRGRSFNPTFDNKLLVLIDGRSVYSPVFSGVFWETLDIVMEDIDRIEVIRGPGTSVWGANAVNGIINIITRPAEETQGLMASAIYGTQEKGTGTVRYGGRFGESNTYRVYGKYRQLGPFSDLDGDELHDGTELGSAGFRSDLDIDPKSDLTLQGDLASGSVKNTLAYPDLDTGTLIQHEGKASLFLGNLLGKYSRAIGDDSSVTVQGYVSRDQRLGDAYDVTVDTFDLDFQHQFSPWEDHVAQWGLAFRRTAMENEYNPKAVSFDDSHRTDDLFSAFAQDEIFFDDGAWILTLGSKFEHNGQTGLELLPSARLLWHATDTQALWGAVSRSVRTPSIAEQDVTYNIDARTVSYFGMDVPLQSSVRGNEDIDAETAVAYELGYRFTPSPRLFVDTALFHTEYENLLSASYSLSRIYPVYGPPFHLQLDSTSANEISGSTYGGELSVRWVPLDWWKLQGWYAYCQGDYSFHGGGTNSFEEMYGRISPQHQFFLHSSMDLPHETELDVMGRYVSELDGLAIPDYFTVDVRIGWRPTKDVEISLVGQNLIENRHLEAASDIVYGSAGAVARNCFLKLRVNF